MLRLGGWSAPDLVHPHCLHHARHMRCPSHPAPGLRSTWPAASAPRGTWGPVGTCRKARGSPRARPSPGSGPSSPSQAGPCSQGEPRAGRLPPPPPPLPPPSVRNRSRWVTRHMTLTMTNQLQDCLTGSSGPRLQEACAACWGQRGQGRGVWPQASLSCPLLRPLLLLGREATRGTEASASAWHRVASQVPGHGHEVWGLGHPGPSHVFPGSPSPHPPGPEARCQGPMPTCPVLTLQEAPLCHLVAACGQVQRHTAQK